MDVYNISDYRQWSSSVLQQQIQPERQTGLVGRDGWDFSSLFGLGHSDPVLEVKYTLLQSGYLQFLFQTEFSVSWRDLGGILKLSEILCCGKTS